ncbi:MAG: hypothetical protein DME91_00180 [Verrucomicrobia bacterium]|nr:MAG: hypothetical protein DME91_00180 [Verrucomicrobiota bacterium]
MSACSRNRAVTRVVAVIATLLFVETAHGADQYDAIRQDIEREIAANRASGVAVSLTQRGKVIWQEGFGWASYGIGGDKEGITRCASQ